MRNTNTIIYSQGGLFSQRTQTSLDLIRAISDGQHLIHLDWNQTGWTDHDRPDDVSRETITQLTAYLQGGLHCFDLPLRPDGASQSRRVLPALPVPPTHQDNLQRKAFLISHETQQLNPQPSENG